MILLFCGPVGSGKTTISDLLAEELKKVGKVHLIRSDEIKRDVYKRIFRRVKEYSDKVDYLILDATFYKRKWREKVKEIAGKKNVVTIFLDCSLEACLKRNEEREPFVEEKVVHIIHHEFERPEDVDVYIDTEELNPDEAVKRVLSRLKLFKQ